MSDRAHPGSGPDDSAARGSDPSVAGERRPPVFAPPSNPVFGGPGSGGLPSAGAVASAPRGPSSGGAVAAFVLALVGALVGVAVGWGLPLSIVALVLALRARRAPGSSRALITAAIVLVAVSALGTIGWAAYSAVYLLL